MKRINHRGPETQSHILLCAFVSLWLILPPAAAQELNVTFERTLTGYSDRV
jgi:hypothetical protein